MRSKSEVVGTLSSVAQFLESIKNQLPVSIRRSIMEGVE